MQTQHPGQDRGHSQETLTVGILGLFQPEMVISFQDKSVVGSEGQGGAKVGLQFFIRKIIE